MAPADAPLFEIDGLRVRAVDGPQILNGIDLVVNEGECHAIMGPNGCGKSTLATSILGSPEYEVTDGGIRFRGDDIGDWEPDDRSRAGIFLAFQHPQHIAGVSVRNFLRQAVSARRGTDVSAIEIYVAMGEWMSRLGMDESFMDRYLNEGFSGGERKRNEILQLALLEPDVAVLDETDSGLDIDALNQVSSGLQLVRAERPHMGVMLITHYERLLDRISPDQVHVMVEGRIVASGGPELAAELERDGYERFERQAAA